MLISESHSFIFIHIYKNAGTSIKAALRPFATSMFQERLSGIAHYPVFGKFALLLMRFDGFNPNPYPSHVTAQRIVSELGNDTYSSYFSCAFVRNPWDWQVSLYNYMLTNRNHHQHELAKKLGNFGEYIRWRCSEEVRYQRDFIFSEQGDLLVNFVGRFEHIEQDFKSICSRIGISVTLPLLNVSSTAEYRDYYDKETRKLVSKTFEPDITTFGYRFV